MLDAIDDSSTTALDSPPEDTPDAFAACPPATLDDPQVGVVRLDAATPPLDGGPLPLGSYVLVAETFYSAPPQMSGTWAAGHVIFREDGTGELGLATSDGEEVLLFSGLAAYSPNQLTINPECGVEPSWSTFYWDYQNDGTNLYLRGSGNPGNPDPLVVQFLRE